MGSGAAILLWKQKGMPWMVTYNTRDCENMDLGSYSVCELLDKLSLQSGFWGVLRSGWRG
jgi:hypothetical protein